jgi:hypothetical protein
MEMAEALSESRPLTRRKGALRRFVRCASFPVRYAAITCSKLAACRSRQVTPSDDNGPLWFAKRAVT